ncbi:CobW family GTP-binding protein [Shewanella colwelliana]|uniref:Cobalamin biosynthesis protein CobW n=1 Tax=Shewanella colwelliana TaxID=23 RepID=A0A1E5ISK2_SHECO|nr:GTP-binding protein [Shewanella colwelliana]MDX1281967.1 GTP-binding protein [Shewanella colwelliana]OEG73539.1 cobalamin biosynthesis protein CobW [Shewanella colwelliana]
MILKPIPTTIITGFLGVGKTTFIKYLLEHKPENEVWAVLVNEFGEIGIDASLMDNQESGVQIKEVAGGCLCCAAGVPTQVAVTQLIAKAKPDRLLIEPTGLGHPKAIVEVLRQPHFEQVIALQSTLCLVDARKSNDERYRDHETFNQQIEIADLIIASKSDLANDDQREQLAQFLREKTLTTPVWPVTLLAGADSFIDTRELYDELTAQFLNVKTMAGRLASKPRTASSRLAMPQEMMGNASIFEARSEPVTMGANGIYHSGNQHDNVYSCGWIFDCSYEFDFELVFHWVKSQSYLRLKAVLICDEGIAGINCVDGELSVAELEDSMDSRLEIIAATPIEIEAIESQLLALSKRLSI